MALLRTLEPDEVEVALEALTIAYEIMDTLDTNQLSSQQIDIAARLLEARRADELTVLAQDMGLLN
jgi:hypothetical protein